MVLKVLRVLSRAASVDFTVCFGGFKEISRISARSKAAASLKVALQSCGSHGGCREGLVALDRTDPVQHRHLGALPWGPLNWHQN